MKGSRSGDRGCLISKKSSRFSPAFLTYEPSVFCILKRWETSQKNYHPRKLLKALVYGYIEKLYSSREIEKALQEHICFMWLCGMRRPDHNTLNRFRKGQLKNTVKDVFAQILLMLIEQGHVRLDNYFVDGTRIESVANPLSIAHNFMKWWKKLQQTGANSAPNSERPAKNTSKSPIGDSDAPFAEIGEANIPRPYLKSFWESHRP